MIPTRILIRKLVFFVRSFGSRETRFTAHKPHPLPAQASKSCRNVDPDWDNDDIDESPSTSTTCAHRIPYLRLASEFDDCSSGSDR